MWVHLSSNGVAERYTRKATASGMIWDMDGNWILGLNHFLGSYTPVEVELWGILDGVLVMLEKGYEWATIQTDNLEVVKALTENEMEDSIITVLRRVERLIHSKGNWWIRFVNIEKNLTVDRMAKLSRTWKSRLQNFVTPSKDVLGAFQ